MALPRPAFFPSQPSPARDGGFSLTPDTIRGIFRDAKPLGHHEDPAKGNLGFGFLYYSLARMLRPRHVLVIGSGFGFSVVCFGLGLKDNARGRLSFVDPSYSILTDGPFKTVGGTSQWHDPGNVRRHFARFGLEDIVTHQCMTSAEFFDVLPSLSLPPLDLTFIDGNHAFESVQHDFRSALRHARKNSYILLHDTNIYVRELVRHAGVKRWMHMLSREKALFEIVDFPFSSGVAIVRVAADNAWRHLEAC